MRIFVRGGHSPKCPGARGLIDELKEDRKVKDSVIKYLKQLGHEVIDVTPPDTVSSSSTDLAYGVNLANRTGGDLFVSIHFNNAYDQYNGAIGSEVCVYRNNEYAERVLDKLAKLGFKNRGQKTRVNLYELKNTKMMAMIIEICFVEATTDVEIYRKHGADTVGRVIAEGIANKIVPLSSLNANKLYRVIAGSYSNIENARNQMRTLKEKGFDSFIEVKE